jgi:hypothetical protein
MRTLFTPLSLALACLLPSCGKPEPTPQDDGLSDLAALQQLGYTDSVDASQSDRPQGVVVHREDAVAHGASRRTRFSGR